MSIQSKAILYEGVVKNFNHNLIQPWFANINKGKLNFPNKMLIFESIETPLNLHHSLFCQFCGRARPRKGRKEEVNGKRGGGGRGGGGGERRQSFINC